jgi:hypothetical protein
MSIRQYVIAGSPRVVSEDTGDRQLGRTATARDSLADETTLLAVAADRLAAGELLPPPLSPPAPAISFQASAPGAAGNDIAVTVSAGSGTVFTAQVSITASETDTYKGLTGAPAARAAIGVDQATNPGDVVGSGLVMVKGSGANEEKGLPKDGQTLTVTGNADVVADRPECPHHQSGRAGDPLDDQGPIGCRWPLNTNLRPQAP